MTLRGIELRYALTRALAVCGSLTVAELVSELSRQGFRVDGRPAKTISDALRWEVRRGRVRRHEHGRYGPGSIPRTTEQRIIARVIALRRLADSRSELALLFDEQ